MKKISLLLLLGLFIFLVGCKSSTTDEVNYSENITNNSSSNQDDISGSRIAVIYFSATGNTKRVAEVIAEVTGGELLEIIPSEPYTSADLNYTDNSCRANQEQNDSNARPGISNTFALDNYDTIFLGYPIWWGTLPKIIYTLCDTYDLSGKTLIPFATSGGSGISSSENALHNLEPAANWQSGRRFSSSVNATTISSWLTELNIEVRK